jgi:hypothetical protein
LASVTYEANFETGYEQISHIKKMEPIINKVASSGLIQLTSDLSPKAHTFDLEPVVSGIDS